MVGVTDEGYRSSGKLSYVLDWCFVHGTEDLEGQRIRRFYDLTERLAKHIASLADFVQDFSPTLHCFVPPNACPWLLGSVAKSPDKCRVVDREGKKRDPLTTDVDPPFVFQEIGLACGKSGSSHETHRASIVKPLIG
jgi:hypothetical protein